MIWSVRAGRVDCGRPVRAKRYGMRRKCAAVFKRRSGEGNTGMARLVDDLRREGYVKTAAVARAMLAADRKIFLEGSQPERAYEDAPLGIGYEQTISAPHMVAIMVEALDATPGMKVLEVGGGSGWHAAVIAGLVRPGGRVVSVERVPELAARAKENLRRAGFSDTVDVVVGDGSLGYPPEAPYDRISVAAAAPRVPESLLRQLKADGGRLLVPVGPPGYQDLIEVVMEGGRPRRDSLGGCVFVPLLGAEGF